MTEATAIFGPLADDYAKYRPTYPRELLNELVRVCELTPDWVVADIGSGTGNAARLFLEAGCPVIGVEPNHEMREAGERLLAAFTAFRSLEGIAESIPLDDHSVDMITVGQALHWFDIDRARAEFRRVLRPGGWVSVMWYGRQSDTTAFTRDYDALTKQRCSAPHMSPSSERSPETDLARLFGTATPRTASFQHTQSFDLDGLLGRARSSGFIPQPGATNHAEFTALLTDLFARHQSSGRVEFHYIAQLRCGQLEDSH